MVTAANELGDMADSEDDSPVVGAVLALLPRIPPAGDEVLSQVCILGSYIFERLEQEIDKLYNCYIPY